MLPPKMEDQVYFLESLSRQQTAKHKEKQVNQAASMFTQLDR